MDAVLAAIRELPLPLLLMAVIAFLYKQKTESEKSCHEEVKALVERYHVMVSEQVRTLGQLAEELEKR